MSIMVELRDYRRKPRIILEFPYSQQAVARAKAISGARWDPDGKVWHYPLDLVTCKLLREAFPSLQIGPQLTAWARAEIDRRASVMELHANSMAKPVYLPQCAVEAPTMFEAMQARGFQTIAPQFAAEVGNYFIADQPGLGKTLMILASLIEVGVVGNVLVVAPRKALRGTWVGQIKQWVGNDFGYGITIADSEDGNMAERNALIEADLAEGIFAHRFHFVLCNPEMMRWEFNCPGDFCTGNKRGCKGSSLHTKTPLYPTLFNRTWDAIIIDETHKFLMNANERSARVSQQGYGFQKLKVSEDGIKIAASGTPFKGKPRRFWPVLHWLRPDKYTGEGKWAKQYFQTEANAYAYDGEVVTDTMREDRTDLFNEDLSMIMVRRTKRELHKLNPEWAPPDKQYVHIELPMDAKQSKAYKAMESEATVRLDSGILMANGILAEMTRLKQLAIGYGTIKGGSYHPALPSCKWDWIKNSFLAERGILDNDGNSKVVIASQFVQVLDLYAAELTKLKVPFQVITGQSKVSVEMIQEDWQNNPDGARVLLLSTQAGGVSLTLDAADDLVLNDETWVPDDQEQVEDRVHRTSRTDHQVTIYRLITLGTIDEAIYQSGDALDFIQKQVLDGRRGVDYAKQLLSRTA